MRHCHQAIVWLFRLCCWAVCSVVLCGTTGCTAAKKMAEAPTPLTPVYGPTSNSVNRQPNAAPTPTDRPEIEELKHKIQELTEQIKCLEMAIKVEGQESRAPAPHVSPLWEQFDSFSPMSLAILGLLTSAGLVSITGLLLFFHRRGQITQQEISTQKKFIEQLVDSQTRTEGQVATLEETLQQLAMGKSSSVKKQETISARLLQIEEQVESLQQQLATMARAAMRAAESAAVATRPTAYAESRRPAAPVAPPETFPVLLHEYLQRKNAEAKAPRFRVAMHGGLESYEGGSLLIIAEGADFLALPSQSRFESSDDFQTVRSFYDCQNPASGEVVLHHPARVRPDATGRVYHLVEKGEISIRR